MLVIPVVILQTNGAAFDLCYRYLAREGLSQPTHFFLTDSPELARATVLSGDYRQMLIMGSFDGDQRAANQFAREMKAKNLKLIVASFSIFGMDGAPYDICIKKSSDGAMASFIAEIRKFLEARERKTLTESAV
jgi:hypothetical protein